MAFAQTRKRYDINAATIEHTRNLRFESTYPEQRNPRVEIDEEIEVAGVSVLTTRSRTY